MGMRGASILLFGTATTLLLAWVVPFVGFQFAPRWMGYEWRSVDDPRGGRTELGRSWLVDWCKAWPSWERGPLAGQTGDGGREAAWPTPIKSGMAAPSSGDASGWDRLDTALVGYPFRAFASEAWYPAGSHGSGRPVFRWNIRLEPIGGGEALVPMRPLVLGLLADVAAWSALAWLALALPRSAIRLLRRRRGACIRCGHDLRGAATCPECGS